MLISVGLWFCSFSIKRKDVRVSEPCFALFLILWISIFIDFTTKVIIFTPFGAYPVTGFESVHYFRLMVCILCFRALCLLAHLDRWLKARRTWVQCLRSDLCFGNIVLWLSGVNSFWKCIYLGFDVNLGFGTGILWVLLIVLLHVGGSLYYGGET